MLYLLLAWDHIETTDGIQADIYGARLGTLDDDDASNQAMLVSAASEIDDVRCAANEHVAWQMAEISVRRSALAGYDMLVQIETCLISITFYDCNVPFPVVDPRIHIPDERLLAIQAERELQVSLVHGQHEEILARVRFFFLLAEPSDKTVRCLRREQDRQQNVLLVWRRDERRLIQLDVAVPFVLTRRFDWRTVLADVASEMDRAIANK